VRLDLEEEDGVTKVRLTHSGLTSELSRAIIKTGRKSWLGREPVSAWLRADIEG
jgi:hypothetical protein